MEDARIELTARPGSALRMCIVNDMTRRLEVPRRSAGNPTANSEHGLSTDIEAP